MTRSYEYIRDQAELLGKSGSGSDWEERAVRYDPVARLGETFVLNSNVGSVPVQVTSLVHEKIQDELGVWLNKAVQKPVESKTYRSLASNHDEGNLSAIQLVALSGLDLKSLPASYESWRYAVELYFLVKDTLYLYCDDAGTRYKKLTDNEHQVCRSPELSPFVECTDKEDLCMVFIVAVPNRLAALGGLRGFRRSFVDAGRAVESLKRYNNSNAAWIWTTEFYDNTCSKILEIDGLERVPLAIGYKNARISDQQTKKAR